jgi:hypothetical protein
MRLTPVVSLVIEEMRQYISDGLPIRSSIKRSVVPVFVKVLFCQAIHEPDDPFIFGFSCSVQRGQVIKQNSVELIWVVTRPIQSSHSNAICRQKVIEGAVKALEEYPDILSVEFI